ncbi:unnamed protein product [Lactuca saligna]|uniref:Transposase MuDR plant domain-containing protein n=1 Tax=Lactuca saligna TaxID=75948 RepID=A0AA36E4Z5_LACSI|nr:unnamed protein product [Lactuca saligna]
MGNHRKNPNSVQAQNNAQIQNNNQESDSEYVQGSDEEDIDDGFEYSTHHPNVKWNIMKQVFRERYESPHELKLCLTNHVISKGYQIHFKKCDGVRPVAIYGSDPKKCPFMVRVSWTSTERSSQVKKIVDLHTCVRSFSNSKLMKST